MNIRQPTDIAPTAREYSWRQILRMVLDHRQRLMRANLLAILATLVSVPVPLLLPLLVDEILLEEPGRAVAVLAWFWPETWHGPVLFILSMVMLALLMRLTALALNTLQAREFSIISKDVVYHLRSRLLERLRRVAMVEYETLGSGRVTSHFVTDLDTVDRFLGPSISKFIVSALTILGTALVLLWVHWQLALLILLLNPVVIYFTAVIGKKVKNLKVRENAAFEVFQEALSETLDGIHQIRAANRERHYISRLVDKARGVRDDATRFEWKSDAAARASFTLFQFGVDAFRGAAMLAVLFSDLSIGMMFAIFGYLWFMLTPIQQILDMQYDFYAANGALGRVNRLMRLREEPTYPAVSNPFEGQRTVGLSLEDVHFRYEDEEILHGISLSVAAGEKVALVGASGGGKSTLVQLLLGMYTPEQGVIRYGGVPVQQIGMDQVRENVATVLQHPMLFNDSVRENLTLGRERSDAQLWDALRVAQLQDTVAAMEHGLDTLIGRNGVRLSGGQRQRLAVARMVLADPRIVILDEATSALDAETEFRLHDALRTFLEGRTTLIIAHRLSAVKQADRVYVFEDGRIIEEGKHSTLLAQQGVYAQLYGHRQS